MYTNNQLTQTGRGRRTYSPEFKAQLVAACRIPGMSVASVARNHGCCRRPKTDPLMASPNSPTRGHPKFPQAALPDYDPSAWTAKRAAASLSL
jgi:hypothetical protein